MVAGCGVSTLSEELFKFSLVETAGMSVGAATLKTVVPLEIVTWSELKLSVAFSTAASPAGLVAVTFVSETAEKFEDSELETDADSISVTFWAVTSPDAVVKFCESISGVLLLARFSVPTVETSSAVSLTWLRSVAGSIPFAEPFEALDAFAFSSAVPSVNGVASTVSFRVASVISLVVNVDAGAC